MSKKIKFEIEEHKDCFVIFRGKQRQTMTAMVWDKWIAELVCSTLNTWESVLKLFKEGKSV